MKHMNTKGALVPHLVVFLLLLILKNDGFSYIIPKINTEVAICLSHHKYEAIKYFSLTSCNISYSYTYITLLILHLCL